ncbi:MAG: hypothetical protein QF577_01685 [Phycisphaerae bacterium]|jgi:hypothetical protein|nr:hypothetical protein [Phycisphaerae bacterium]
MSQPGKSGKPAACGAPEPVDVVEGIPDRIAASSRWKIVLIVVVFAAWVAFLIYCRYAGRLEQ